MGRLWLLQWPLCPGSEKKLTPLEQTLDSRKQEIRRSKKITSLLFLLWQLLWQPPEWPRNFSIFLCDSFNCHLSFTFCIRRELKRNKLIGDHWRDRKRFNMGHWLTCLQRLRHPTICSLQAGDPDTESVVWRPESWWVNSEDSSPGLKARKAKGRRRCVSQLRVRHVQSSYFFLFHETLEGLVRPTDIGESPFLRSVHQVKCSFLLKIFPQTHPERMFKQLSGELLVQLTQKMNHFHGWLLRITEC